MYRNRLISLIMEKSQYCASTQEKQSPNHEKLSTYLAPPNLWKNFEKIIFDEIYEHLTANKLLSDKQPGFRRGDSTINQLLSITHDIYNAFEHHHDTRAVFLDISKAFEKVWHEGLLLKL